MKLSTIAAVVLSIGAVSGASGAIAADFTGLGLAADLQFKSTGGLFDYTDSSDGEDFRQKISWGGDQDVIGGLNLNYGFALAPRVVLQVGATADLSKTEVYEVTQSLSSPVEVTNLHDRIEEKNHFSIYLAPGYLLTPKTMIYAKLAYHSMKQDWYSTFSDASGTEVDNTSNSFKGFGLGFGLQAMVTDKLYAYAEVQRVQYGRESLSTPTENTTFKVRSTIGALGIGYRF